MNQSPSKKISPGTLLFRFSFYLFTLIIAVPGCAETVKLDYDDITVDSLKTIIDQNENILVIDVRTEEEFDGELGHVKGTILRPVQQISDWYREFFDYKDTPVYLICRSGNRSGRAGSFLSEKGYNKVYNILGGMRAWNRAGYPIERAEPEVLEEVPY
jgi:rhodanese-related sulfurtransferase